MCTQQLTQVFTVPSVAASSLLSVPLSTEGRKEFSYVDGWWPALLKARTALFQRCLFLPMVTTNHQQAVGNGGRPAPHHPVPGNMWTEGLSRADRQQKKKKEADGMSLTFLYFTFVYRLCHLGRRGKKETFVCCTTECLGSRDVVQR